MTQEELAEEYVRHNCDDSLNSFRGQELKQAYIEGYNKANEWHKVTDGDIPENERWVCNQDGCYCYYDIDTEQWLDLEGTRTRTIEWCDMPTKEIE